MNTLKKQFSDALKREGKSITTYYTSESVKCLFRINKDYNKTTNHITIFYDIDSPIKQGQLLTYGGKNYITLNQESVENDTYYKSSLLECNVTIPISIGGAVKNIPCYSYELTSAYNIANNIIRFVDGKGKIITELIPELFDGIYINTGLRIMGGYFDVVNTYDIDGIVYIMLEKNVTPPDVYDLEITTELSEYKVGETTTITANPTINGIPQTDQTITYISSDETVATVDENGLVTFITFGDVVITATWVERTLTKTLGLSVVADPNVKDYTVEVRTLGNVGLIINGSTTFIPTLKDDTGIEVPFPATPVWTFNYNGMATSNFTITYDGNNCKIKVAENYDIIGEVLRVICTTADGKWTGYVDMMITAGW